MILLIKLIVQKETEILLAAIYLIPNRLVKKVKLNLLIITITVKTIPINKLIAIIKQQMYLTLLF